MEQMKTPISYYGGKQTLASVILKAIPEHRLYCEPFLGGAAVFFAKPLSKLEIINDINGELINFYWVMKHNFEELQKEVEVTLHSRKLYMQAKVVYNNPDMFSPVKRAWAVWVLANMAFGSNLNTSFGYGKKSNKYPVGITNKRNNFNTACKERLEKVTIECREAITVINNYDSAGSFFYIDPPYVGAEQGHYKGYTQAEFDVLLQTLKELKGKFILSSYRNEILKDYALRNGWHSVEFKMPSSMTVRDGKKVKEKVEVLTGNYPFQKQLELIRQDGEYV